jgi:hypothetical protein
MDRACIGNEVARDQAQRRGLAAAVRSIKRDELAFGDIEIETM